MSSGLEVGPAEGHGPEAAGLVDHLFRHHAGRMVASLTRVFGLANLELAEDVVQDALVKALHSWPYHGVPNDPGSWLLRVARNRAIDELRRRGWWNQRKALLERHLAPEPSTSQPAALTGEIVDDQLRMIFACCHPSLPRASQVALTLKTVSGFAVSELARAFLVAESTMAQRIVRAKRALRASDAELAIPEPHQLDERLEPVLEVLYVLFNEGYSASEGAALLRADLSAEAIRLVRLLTARPRTALPQAHALAALFLFHAARFSSRVDAAGDLLLLEHQDRSLWNRAMISEASRHLRQAGEGDALTRYHLEAEIAGHHASAPSYRETDWRAILHCYDVLGRLAPSPVIALNRLVALAEVEGAEAALAELDAVAGSEVLERYAPLWAIRGELLARTGSTREAVICFDRAQSLTESRPVRRHLARRREELEGALDPG